MRYMCMDCFDWSELSHNPEDHKLKCPVRTGNSGGEWKSVEHLLTEIFEERAAERK